MNPQKKIIVHQPTEEQQQTAGHQQIQHEAVQEFATVEEMLHHDALHTPVPPAIAQRLQESAAQLAPPNPRPWWRKLLGR